LKTLVWLGVAVVVVIVFASLVGWLAAQPFVHMGEDLGDSIDQQIATAFPSLLPTLFPTTPTPTPGP
jgi:ABC-type protease/lipase transport system fused ATPase/permease subunit